MRGRRTFIGRCVAGARLAGVLLALAAPVVAQVSGISITSVQSSIFTEGTVIPANVQGITIGTNANAVPEIVVYLNGTFLVGTAAPTVQWTDPVNNTAVTLEVLSSTPTQIQVLVTSDLWSASLGVNPRTVRLQVIEGNFTANANYFLYAPMAMAASPLPVATTGVSYSAPLVTGGTPPFVVDPPILLGNTPAMTPGAAPSSQIPAGVAASRAPMTSLGAAPQAGDPAAGSVPGLTLGTGPQGQLISGTPTTVGVYQLTPNVYDFWGNYVTGLLTLQVIAPATAASVTPNSAVAGSGYLQITVTGTGFVDPQSPAGGSVVQWTKSNVTTALATTYVSGTQLTAIVPTALMSGAGTATISVLQPNRVAYGSLTFSLPAPVLTSLSPSAVFMGSGAFTMTLNGANFVSRVGAPDVQTGPFLPVVRFGATVLNATLVNSGQLTVVVPQNLLTYPGQYSVQVANPGGSSSNLLTFTVYSTLAVSTSSLPLGTVGVPYSFTLQATGGFPGTYRWNITGLPPGFSYNSLTGAFSGTPQTVANYTINAQVTDTFASVASATLVLIVAQRQSSFTTDSALPDGIVGTPYFTTIEATGAGPFTFSLSSGQLPDGIHLLDNGQVSGNPTRAGTFSFLVVLTDAVGNTPTKSFTITIKIAPLTAGGPSTTLTTGTPATIPLTASGGTPPYSFALNCTLPDGLSFAGSSITGTPTTPGTANCTVTVTDSAKVTASKGFTITVIPAPITFTGGTLPAGQAGVSYSGQVSARGGTPPFTYTATGLPDGLSIAPNGAISGTPATAGKFSITVTATDSARGTATAAFSILIAPAPLSITTKSLPDGAVGVAYSANLTATGGTPPYTWTISGTPGGVGADATGAFTGAPTTVGTVTISVSVKDVAGATASASFSLKITPPPLVITTAGAPGGTVGKAYTAGFSASGGVPPLTWSATGLPGGLSMSSTGSVSGTPGAPGTANATVTVRDSTGVTTSKDFSIAIVLPSTPPVNFGGVTGGTSNPAQQPVITVSLGSPFPVDVIVTLTLTFAPDSGADDPAIQFLGGGRTVQITIPAGSTTGTSGIGVQTGTVAGLITITSHLQAAGQNVTPAPVPTQTIRINPGAPVVSQVTGARTSSGFTVTVTGFVTDREVTQAIFQFNAASGATLQTTSLTVATDALFASYFGSAAAAPFGGQFIFTQQFTVSGNLQGVASVTVTLVNKIGSSTPATATLN